MTRVLPPDLAHMGIRVLPHVVRTSRGTTRSTVPLKRVGLIPFFGSMEKAHAVVVTDEELSTEPVNSELKVMVVKKTPTVWRERVILYIVRALADRGRIILFER